MTNIQYQVGQTQGEITWAASEHFDELRNHTYDLGQMEATQIEQLSNLSLTAKILLSAVASALIQHLLDQGLPAAEIFSQGKFKVL